MNATESVVWVVPKWPLPCEDGARQATVQQIRGLVARGLVIDLVALAPADEACDPLEATRGLGLRSATVVRVARGSPARAWWRAARTFLAHPRHPATLSRFLAGPVCRDARAAAAAVADARWLVVDGLHAAAPFVRGDRLLAPPALRRVVYRAHNVETDLWRRAAEQARHARVRRLVLLAQAARVERFERALLGGASCVVTVSPDDVPRLEALGPRARIVHVPIAIDFGDGSLPPPPRSDGPPRLLYVGRLDWAPNRDGLAWFLGEVWPATRAYRPDLVLTIAGSGDGRWLADFGGLPGVRLLGRVSDVAPLYAEATAVVVPILYGSGTRVKVLEAARFGRACVSTAVGVQGSGLDEGLYLRAEGPGAWIETLSRLDPARCAEMGRRAWRFGRERFSVEIAAERFHRVLAETDDIREDSRCSVPPCSTS